MYYNQSFDEMPEDMLLHGKLKNDGGHNLFQRDPPPSRWKKRRRKYVDKEVEVDDSVFESAKQAYYRFAEAPNKILRHFSEGSLCSLVRNIQTH